MTKHQAASVVREDAYAIFTMCLSESLYILISRQYKEKENGKLFRVIFYHPRLEVAPSLLFTFCLFRFFQQHVIVTLCLALALRWLEGFSVFLFHFLLSVASAQLCTEVVSLSMLCPAAAHCISPGATSVLVRVYVSRLWEA